MIHVNRERQNLGQFTPEDVSAGLRSGRFLPTDLAWREGMETWQPLATFTDLPAPDETAPPTLAPGTPLPPQPENDFPWTRRKEIGIFTALWETISQSLAHPGAGFSRLPEAPKIGDCYSFYLLMALITGALSTAMTLAFVKYATTMLAASSNAADPDVAQLLVMLKSFSAGPLLFMLLVVFPLVPFVAAGVYHALLMLLGGANASFQKTFAVTCYVLGSLSPFQLLPCCGSFVQIIWGLISLSIGLAAAHRTDAWRAALAVAIALLLCCGGYLGFSVLGSMANLGNVPSSISR